MKTDALCLAAWACPHCGATPGNWHAPECKRPRPPEPPEPADVRRDALEQAAKLCEFEAEKSDDWELDGRLRRVADAIRALDDA